MVINERIFHFHFYVIFFLELYCRYFSFLKDFVDTYFYKKVFWNKVKNNFLLSKFLLISKNKIFNNFFSYIYFLYYNISIIPIYYVSVYLKYSYVNTILLCFFYLLLRKYSFWILFYSEDFILIQTIFKNIIKKCFYLYIFIDAKDF